MTIILGKQFKSRLSGTGEGETYKILAANSIDDTYTIVIEKVIQGVTWYRNETGKYSDLKRKFESDNFKYCE